MMPRAASWLPIALVLWVGLGGGAKGCSSGDIASCPWDISTLAHNASMFRSVSFSPDDKSVAAVIWEVCAATN